MSVFDVAESLLIHFAAFATPPVQSFTNFLSAGRNLVAFLLRRLWNTVGFFEYAPLLPLSLFKQVDVERRVKVALLPRIGLA